MKDFVFTGMKNNHYSVYGRNKYTEKDKLQDKLKKYIMLNIHILLHLV